MYSLFAALLAQHARQLTPVRCAHSTIAQLHRYFEDVVLENNLSALVIESLPTTERRTPREIVRVRNLTQSGRRTFFFVGKTDDLTKHFDAGSLQEDATPVLMQHPGGSYENEHFVVIADARFSALLATVRTNTNDVAEDEVVWTFEPDVVYSALEYLQARVHAEHPYHATAFGNAVHTSMPKATSLQLTLSVTTKLAHLLQEQAGREIALNRIATAIRESLELGVILQKTVTEVGAALSVSGCALQVEAQTELQALSYSYFSSDETTIKLPREEVTRELETISAAIAQNHELYRRDGAEQEEEGAAAFPLVVLPLVFQGRFMGTLGVIDDNPARMWQENEILLLRTVANQVTVAINQADLYALMQKQALTDALTGCYNRRSLELHLDRELKMALRQHQPLSLLMLDLDRFKQLNDTIGHDAGDVALQRLADCFRQELRGVDTAARYGGDEFALILPQAYAEGAVVVAERLRRRVEEIDIAGFGRLTVSIGVATFPLNASSRQQLISAADAALYSAKRGGRNRIAAYEWLAEGGRSEILSSEFTQSDERVYEVM